jgi:DNA-binding transcriptional LysR family regulator
MEIRQLKYLLSAIRHGSIKESARENFVTQPAVSIQLKKLEEEVGEKLFIRRGRQVVPTQVGEAFIAQADDILKRVESLRVSTEEFKSLRTGFLCLGAIDSAGVYVLPPVFRTFRRKFPGIEIRVAVSDTRGLMRSLQSGEIELAVATLPPAGEGYVVRPIYRDDMVLVAHPQHQLAQARRPSLRAVAESGLIMYPPESTTRRLIEQVFLAAGISPRAAMEISSPEAMKRLTETGLGASILPFQVVAAEIRRGSLKVIPTGKAKFYRRLGVVYKNDENLSPPGRVFLNMLLEKYAKEKH